MSPLHESSIPNREDRFQQLLEMGADVNGCIENVPLVFHAFQSNNWFSSVMWLLDHGVPIDARHPQTGDTLLHQAVDSEQISFLLEHGADVNSKNNRDSSPLHCACSKNYPDIEIIEILLSGGANVNSLDENGNTPSHLFQNGKNAKKCVALMLSNGADLLLRNNAGFSVLDLGNFGDKFLIKHGFKKQSTISRSDRPRLQDTIGGRWNLKTNTGREGLLLVSRSSPKHNWNIKFKFGFEAKVKQYHVKLTLDGNERLKFRFMGCDATGEGEKDPGTGWLEVIHHQPFVLAGKLYTAYGIVGFVATPENSKKSIPLATANPENYCGESSSSSDDYTSDRNSSEEEAYELARIARWH